MLRSMLATEPTPPETPVGALDLIVGRARSLYTLPAVAVEVLRLTESPKVDVRSLKQSIERDPALTVKILRVVNSSVFGLPREVGDLNQALSLLGIKPLKLLALGFSLPESLFLAAAGDQLDWYWRSTLVRAVAAREISEQLFGKPGDDAFLAGLLQDLGVLVLLGQFGPTYATLLQEAIASPMDLGVLEQAAIGFDHRLLTARLLEHWNLPPLLVAAIGEERDVRRWARNQADHAHLVRVLHLAELLAQLVGQRRLSVLPDLLQAGEAYCLLDRSRLNDLIAGLEPKVRQLAAVLSLKAPDTGGYCEILVHAHQRMAELAEAVAGPLSRRMADDEIGAADSEDSAQGALSLAMQLRASFDQFFCQPAGNCAPLPQGGPPPGRSDSASASSAKIADPGGGGLGPRPGALAAASPYDEVTSRLTLAVGHCRASRKPLGVVLVAVQAAGPLDGPHEAAVERALGSALRGEPAIDEVLTPSGSLRQLLVLVGRDRPEAVDVARSAVERLRRMLAPMQAAKLLPECAVAAGVAWVDLPAKNFDPRRLVETAERCLVAAIAAGGVKSLEVS